MSETLKINSICLIFKWDYVWFHLSLFWKSYTPIVHFSYQSSYSQIPISSDLKNESETLKINSVCLIFKWEYLSAFIHFYSGRVRHWLPSSLINRIHTTDPIWAGKWMFSNLINYTFETVRISGTFGSEPERAHLWQLHYLWLQAIIRLKHSWAGLVYRLYRNHPFIQERNMPCSQLLVSNILPYYNTKDKGF